VSAARRPHAVGSVRFGIRLGKPEEPFAQSRLHELPFDREAPWTL